MKQLAVLLTTLCVTLLSIFTPPPVQAGLTELGEECFLLDMRCKSQLDTKKWGFVFADIKFGELDKPGTVHLNPKLNKQLFAVLTSLDSLKVKTCKALSAKEECDPNRDIELSLLFKSDNLLEQAKGLIQSYSEKPGRLKNELSKWLIRSAMYLDLVYSGVLKSEKGSSDQLKRAKEAAEYALAALKITRESPEYQTYIRNPFVVLLEEAADRKM